MEEQYKVFKYDYEWDDSCSERLKSLIQRSGLTVVELANRSGVCHATIRNYCNNFLIPMPWTLNKILRAMNYTMDDIYYPERDEFWRAGFSDEECKKLRQISEAYNIDPDKIISIVKYMTTPGIEKYDGLERLIFELSNKKDK